MSFNKLILVAVLTIFSLTTNAQDFDYAAITQRSVELLEKLVNAKSITGCEEEVNALIIERLKQLGLEYKIILSGDAPVTPAAAVTDPGGLCLDGRQPSTEKRPNIIVKLKSSADGEKQLKSFMVVAHMDVVPAIKQVWSPGILPHKLTLKDDYYYGRGTLDMLSYLVFSVELFGEIKRQNIKLDRDMILMLNSDEEKGGMNGMGWLVNNQPELFTGVELAISEGGATVADDSNQPLFIGYEAAQKRYQDFKIVAQGDTGHSSTPAKIQAVNLLNEALAKIQRNQAQPRLIPIIKSYFKERAKVETDPVLKSTLAVLGSASDADSARLSVKYKNEVKLLESKYPVVHALLRRTCTTTVVEAGSASAKNAQPQTATAFVNCRLMPDETVDQLLPVFKKAIDQSFGDKATDPKITIDLDIDYRKSHGGASDINGIIPKALKKYADNYFKGIPVIPSMLTGATDLRYLRKMGIQAYGFGPVIISDNDRKRAHGIDERIFAGKLQSGIEVFSGLVLDIASPSSRKPASEKAVYPGEVSKSFKHAFGDELPHNSNFQH